MPLPRGASDLSSSLIVSAQQDLVSVKANNASLREVVERIGQELNIPVQANIGDEERVSAEFERLPLEEALKHLSANYAYIRNGDRIAKIVLFPKGQAAPAVPQKTRVPAEGEVTEESTGQGAGSEPFQLDVEPSETDQEVSEDQEH
jgi:type II secretory pathway component GspD/PulD (secretin)